MDNFVQLLNTAGPQVEFFIMGFLLVFLRIIPIIYLFPPLGGEVVSSTIKIAFGLGITAIVYPYISGDNYSVVFSNPLFYFSLCLKELFIGFSFGFLCSLMFQTLMISGEITDILRGANMSETILLQNSEERSNILGNFSLQLGIVYFIIINGHSIFFSILVNSYSTLPVNILPIDGDHFLLIIRQSLRLSSLAISYGLSLSMPVILAAILSDITMAILGKTASHLGSFFIGVPFKTALILIIFTLSMREMLPLLYNFFNIYIQNIHTLILR